MCVSTAFDVYSPTVPQRAGELRLVVVAQVAFERHILKPVFHLIGYRIWV
jgi:hypothetical protein